MNDLKADPLHSGWCARSKPIWPILKKPDWIDVRQSAIHGFGAFANRVIQPRQLIADLDGQILTVSELARIKQDTRSVIHESLLDYFFMEWNCIPDYTNSNRIMARPFRTIYSYLNHARSPNCRIAGKYPGEMLVETIREISDGEELLLDYREESIPHWYLDGHGSTYL